MWITHEGALYNLAHAVSISKVSDTQIDIDTGKFTHHLNFDGVEVRDEYYQHIQRLVFNLGPSV